MASGLPTILLKFDFGDVKGALSDLNDALLLRPSGYLHMEIANLKRANKDLEGAIESYDTALKTVKTIGDYYGDEAATYVFRPSGELWSIRSNLRGN